MVRDEKDRVIVMLGYDARNTIGNAMETAQWVRKEGIRSLRLVTANYHMPRALAEFRYAMPPDTVVLPDAVISNDVDLSSWWKLDPASDLLLSEYHKLMAAHLRHWLIDATEKQ
jgi:uncharacterized SAM-binding protein YcdF (DUF218 family)